MVSPQRYISRPEPTFEVQRNQPHSTVVEQCNDTSMRTEIAMATPHSPPTAGGDGSRYGLRHAWCTQAADRRKGPTRREPAYGGQNKTAKCALMLALTVVTALAANWRAGDASTRRSRPHLCRGVGPGKYWLPALLGAQMLATGAATTKPALQTYDHNDLCRQPGAKRSLRKAQARLLKQGETWYNGRFYRRNLCPQIGVWPRRRPRIQVESRRGQRAGQQSTCSGCGSSL